VRPVRHRSLGHVEDTRRHDFDHKIRRARHSFTRRNLRQTVVAGGRVAHLRNETASRAGATGQDTSRHGKRWAALQEQWTEDGEDATSCGRIASRWRTRTYLPNVAGWPAFSRPSFSILIPV